MSKQTRKERRKKEAELIAEFDDALKKERGEEAPMYTVGEKNAPTEKIHCRRCKTLMENGKCPVCGYKIYVPMDEEKRKKIRWVVTGVCLVVFVVLFALIQK